MDVGTGITMVAVPPGDVTITDRRTQSSWSVGVKAYLLDARPRYRANSHGRAHDVGGKQPNDWGLYDMLGNVWEWCWDIYDPEVYGDYRVLRGGGWFDEHWSCRASVRRRSHPAFQIDDVGFRVARNVAPPFAR